MQDSLKNKVVALFGEVLVDVFPDSKVLGGAPFNVARHLQAFGATPLLITRTGNDETRDALLAEMARLGMDERGIQTDMNHPSGTVNVTLDEKGHRFDILPDQAYDHIHAGVVHMIALAVRPKMVYFGTLAQRSHASRRALSALLSSSDSPRFLDLNLRAPWYDLQTIKRSLRRADILKLNDEELSKIAAMLRLPGELAQQAASLAHQYDIEQILVTCGDKGAWHIDRGGCAIHANAEKTEVADSVGAGDGFSTMMILGQICDWPIELSLSRANAFAAAICGIRGAVPSDPSFYDPFLEEWKCTSS